jgi:hypothetical protein
MSHNNNITGILDMNGVLILNGCKVKVHDTHFWKSKDNEDNIGVVIWKQGNYIVEGTYCPYNVYAWRKHIEVIDSNGESRFDLLTMEEAWEEFRKTLSILTTDFTQIKKAFKYAWESSRENIKL